MAEEATSGADPVKDKEEVTSKPEAAVSTDSTTAMEVDKSGATDKEEEKSGDATSAQEVEEEKTLETNGGGADGKDGDINPPKLSEDNGSADGLQKGSGGGVDDFEVLEEDDTDDDDNGKEDEVEEVVPVEKKDPEVVDLESIPTGKENEKTEVMETEAEKEEKDVQKGSSPMKNGENPPEKEEVLLANPFFGKSDVPVINIGDSDDEAGEGDYGDDNEEEEETTCCNSAKEKKALQKEVKRLNKAVTELSLRQASVEDFLFVEFYDRYKQFCKNREHLLSMGFGGVDAQVKKGKRAEKAPELLELLGMIARQGKEKSGDNASSTATPPPAVESSPVAKDTNKKEQSEPKKQPSPKQKQGGSPALQKTTPKQQKQPPQKNVPKKQQIPSLLSHQSTRELEKEMQREQERLRRLEKEAKRKQEEEARKRSEIDRRRGQSAQDKIKFQQQQQQLAQLKFANEQQLRSDARYYDEMYAKAIRGGTGDQGSSKDYVMAVPRGGGSIASSGGYGKGGKYSAKDEERKRKRESGGFSSDSSMNGYGFDTPSPLKFVPNPRAELPPPKKKKGSWPVKTMGMGETDDRVDHFLGDGMGHPESKRVCPLCDKVVQRKKLRDHLLNVHQKVRMVCPACLEEFNNKGNLKTHIKDRHNVTTADIERVISRINATIEDQYGAWLMKKMAEAEIPTRERLVQHFKEVIAQEEKNIGGGSGRMSMEGESDYGYNNAPMSSNSGYQQQQQIQQRIPQQIQVAGSHNSRYFESGGGGNGQIISQGGGHGMGGMMGMGSSGNGALDGGGGAVSRIGRAAPAPPTASDLYGPGGYAQYAAGILQQRGGGGGSGGFQDNRGGGYGYSGGNQIYTPF